MEGADPDVVVREHLRRFFEGHECRESDWPRGPAREEMRSLRVAEFAPGPRCGHWVYATIGVGELRDDPRLEFLLVAPGRDRRPVELLTMVAWYHWKEGLSEGHTLPIGEPWLPGSECDGFLVSLPYPFGPDLEVCQGPGWDLRFLWLLPITDRERRFKIREGQEALERRFDECGLEYADPGRWSVV